MQRWDPFSEVRQMQRMMNRLWRGIETDGEAEGVEAWAVPMDVIEEDDSIVVRSSIPGIKPEDLQVTIEDNVLTIRGESQEEREKKQANYLLRERRAGMFHRSLRLPGTVDTEKAQTSCENGVLTVTFPKAESKKAKRLEVKAAS